jgi:BON domain
MIRRMVVFALGACLAHSASVFGQQANAPLKVSDAKSLPVSIPPMPSTGLAPNPALAQAIVRTFQQSGQLYQYRINVIAFGGEVELHGEIADESQRAAVIRLLKTVPSITMVRDSLVVRPAVNYASMMAYPNPWMSGVVPVQAPIPPLPSGPMMQPPIPERIDGQLPEPKPIFQAPPGPNPNLQAPPLPPNAWPTFAPYNNYSRVAYPNAYPYEQWPFIGPMYPFPQVPLGWRSVSLTWEDGHWWFHRNPTGHDWWRVRYH